MKKGLLIVGMIVVLIGGFLIGSYNGLASSRENIASAQADIDTMLQRRADLIPNLVATVKGYAQHEESTLTQVVEARAKATQTQLNIDDAAAMSKYMEAQGELSSALSRLMAISENYPDLKANQNFLDLQTQLEGTENRIATERRKYNESARQFNTMIKMFPRNMVAGMFGFAPLSYFEAEEGAQQAPQVSFE